MRSAETDASRNMIHGKIAGQRYENAVTKGHFGFFPNTNLSFQIGSFNESHLVTSAIIVDGEIVVIMGNGRFGKVKIHENEKCSFVWDFIRCS